MHQARLILCERTSRWAVAFRRALGQNGPKVWETRSLPECRRELEKSPQSCLALELTQRNAARLLEWLVDTADEFPGARTIVLADRQTEAYAWYHHEAGPVQIVFSPRRLQTTARLIRRHLDSVPDDASFRDTVWRRLPWRG